MNKGGFTNKRGRLMRGFKYVKQDKEKEEL